MGKSALTFGLAALLSSETAWAGSFTWVVSEDARACAGEGELRAHVAETLGYDAFASEPGPALRGEIRRENQEFVASIELVLPNAAPERRELRAPIGDCVALSRSAALVIALAVEGANAPNPPPPPLPEASVPPPPAAPPRPDRYAPLEPSESGWSRSLDVIPVARWSLGMLPRPTTGLGALVRYRVGGRWSLAAGGDFLPSASERGRFSMSFVGGRAALCFDWLRAATFGASSCAAALGGALSIRDEAAHTPAAGTDAWFAGALGAEAIAFLGGRWVFSGGLEAAVPFERPIYRATGCPQVAFQEPFLVALVHAGLGASFF